MSKTETAVIATVIAIAVAAMITSIMFTSGRWQTVEVVQVDDNTKCAIVSRGTHVSVDCWVLEKENVAQD